MGNAIVVYKARLKKDMPEWKNEDYGLHAILASLGKELKVGQIFFDGVPDESGGKIIMEPMNEEDDAEFRSEVLNYAKEYWFVDEDVTEEQFFGENAEDYCERWMFGLEDRFFELLEEIPSEKNNEVCEIGSPIICPECGEHKYWKYNADILKYVCRCGRSLEDTEIQEELRKANEEYRRESESIENNLK